MTETPLDLAHQQMEINKAKRLAFYQTLSAAELFVLLETEADDDQIIPQAFEVEGQTFVLAFDTEARLSEFAGAQANFVALSGRAVAEMLAEGGLGLGLNLQVARSQMLLPTEAMVWLSETLQQAPDQVQAQIRELHPPKGLPETLLTALDQRLATMGGLAELAYLAGVTYDNDTQGHLLGFIDAQPPAHAALAQAISDVLQLSGLDAAILDVGFFDSTDPIAPRLALVGLRFDLPKAKTPTQTAPGSDPNAPPKLR